MSSTVPHLHAESFLQLGIHSNWSFAPSNVPRWRKRTVFESFLLRSIRAPKSLQLVPVIPAAMWALFFIYLKGPNLSAAHRFTLRRLREQGLKIFVVIASPAASALPCDLREMVDALYWKDLPGYDFSAYALGLRVLARDSPAATVLVLNDSVHGPACDLSALMTAPPWDLTGFTASGKIENHIQSYAFILRSLTREKLAAMRTVFLPFGAFRQREDVISCQESRFARVAARSMTVGALWYQAAGDLTQSAPFELMDAGLPFLKRSLIEERSAFGNKCQARKRLDALTI